MANVYEAMIQLYTGMVQHVYRYGPTFTQVLSNMYAGKGQEVYSRRGIYNQREKYNQWGFRGHFCHLKTTFLTFSVWILNFAEFAIRNKKKKFEKILVSGENFFQKINFFFIALFWLPFFSAANNFRQIWNHILIGL
jgi:hypothetical protein